MLTYIANVIQSKNPNLVALKVLLILAILMIILMMYRFAQKNRSKSTTEGFTQKDAFVLKRNHDVYDDFYAEVYDGINEIKTRNQEELMKIIQMTEPTTIYSRFLDVGSGTGYIVNALTQAGYKAYGIDKSEDMAEYGCKMYPEIDDKLKVSDVSDPMSFEKGTFTHILCMNSTMYDIEDKTTFFRNCYTWLQPNAYLIIHLVEPDRFNLVAPDSIPYYSSLIPKLTSSTNTRTNSRITDAMVEFYDFKYTASYRFPNHVNYPAQITYTQTFTDRATQNVRQNEQTLHMDTIKNILDIATKAGFIYHAKSETAYDKHQYIYVFERPM